MHLAAATSQLSDMDGLMIDAGMDYSRSRYLLLEHSANRTGPSELMLKYIEALVLGPTQFLLCAPALTYWIVFC